MINHFLSGYIVDTDPQSAKHLAGTLKSVFNKVYYETDLKKVVSDCQDLKPQVVFINLGIEQRSSNLEVRESLANLDQNFLFFAYLEKIEPELLAHAIESGFQDVFARPFDADVISTKINRNIQSEGTRQKNLGYFSLSPVENCTFECPIQITSVDENGLRFRSPHYISKGSILPLKSKMIREIFGKDEVDFIVTQTAAESNWTGFTSYAEPRIASEEKSAALRRFLLEKKN